VSNPLAYFAVGRPGLSLSKAAPRVHSNQKLPSTRKPEKIPLATDSADSPDELIDQISPLPGPGIFFFASVRGHPLHFIATKKRKVHKGRNGRARTDFFPGV
jgi:hypothetical protein